MEDIFTFAESCISRKPRGKYQTYIHQCPSNMICHPLLKFLNQVINHFNLKKSYHHLTALCFTLAFIRISISKIYCQEQAN